MKMSFCERFSHGVRPLFPIVDEASSIIFLLFCLLLIVCSLVGIILDSHQVIVFHRVQVVILATTTIID